MGRDAVSTRESTRSKYVILATTLRRRYDDPAMTSIFAFTIISLLILGGIAYTTQSVFFTDAIISIAVVTIIYQYRHALLFSWEGALLAATGWLMNMLGTLGAYEIYISGIGWDKALHFVSILGVTMLAYAYLQRHDLRGIELAVLVFFIAQGFGALNEILEFIGTQYFGAGQGLFGMMNGMTEPANKFYQFDTHWDLVTNTIAIVAGLFYMATKRRIYKRRLSSV